MEGKKRRNGEKPFKTFGAGFQIVSDGMEHIRTNKQLFGKKKNFSEFLKYTKM